MGKGSAAGVVRSPNIGTGPLLIITGNSPTPGIPQTGPGTPFNASGPAGQYTAALMWEANGFTKWAFSIQGSFSPCSVAILGTWDYDTVTGSASNWATLVPSVENQTTGVRNPMINPGDYFEFDRALRGISVVVNNYTGTFPVNLFVEATP